MGLVRRVTLSLATAVSMLAVLTVASVGAAGGFGQAPGHYNFSDTSANVSFFNPVDQSNENVSVDRSLFRFIPKGGGGIVTQNETVLSVNVFVPNPTDPTLPPILSAVGCFFIPASDFVVSSDLQHASLKAKVNESDSCPGFLVPVLGSAPAKAGGGGGGGFTFPLTVTASWTGTGLVGDQSDQGLFTCGTFRSITQTDSKSAFSSAVSATISGFGSISSGPDTFGSVNVSQQQLQVTGSGILPAGCLPGGKGG
jgi:hypothetical protein